MDPVTFNFATAQKMLFDGSVVGLNQYLVSLAIRAGTQVYVFSMVPEDAKDLAATLTAAVVGYEKQYGPIPNSKKPVPSPVDLSKPSTDL